MDSPSNLLLAKYNSSRKVFRFRPKIKALNPSLLIQLEFKLRILSFLLSVMNWAN